MATPPKFRIDVDIHDLLMNAAAQPAKIPTPKGATLPVPMFPQHPEKLLDPGPATIPEYRDWTLSQIYRKMRGWLFPYVRSRTLAGDFHPITAYLFLEYKCNLDCWYCWAFNNKVKGMTEDVARRSIDWLHDHGCRVLGLMGGEPLLRPDFAHKVVNYAAKKGFWIYVGTNGRLLREVAAAGAEQVILVTASSPESGAHELSTGRAELRGRAGEHLTAFEAAGLSDVLEQFDGRFAGLFVIRPAHNPLGPLDFGGVYDERSDRRQALGELVDRGYEDAYRQFIEPVVGAGGDPMEVQPANGGLGKRGNV